MAELSLTPTSYLVLGLVASFGPCTSYDLKRVVGISIGCFWPFPHSQLYAEPARLAEHGYLEEDQEQTGRRRRTYAITRQGREALGDWLAEPTSERTELRDLGLLKLFFGQLSSEDELVALAQAKQDVHRVGRADYERLQADLEEVASPAQLATLELGIRWEQAAEDFWAEVAAAPPVGDARRPARIDDPDRAYEETCPNQS